MNTKLKDFNKTRPPSATLLRFFNLVQSPSSLRFINYDIIRSNSGLLSLSAEIYLLRHILGSVSPIVIVIMNYLLPTPESFKIFGF
jgi:hypothetical protein